MDQHLTDLDRQIAATEAEIAEFRALLAKMPHWSNGAVLDEYKRDARVIHSKIASLSKQHEQLVVRVQRWTVGASRGMEVG